MTKSKAHKDPRIKIAAYHEAGHIVFSYYVQWAAKEVKLLVDNNNVKQAITTYDFKGDEKIIKSLGDIQLIRELTADEQSRLYEVIHKRCKIVVAGPIAEAIYLEGGITNRTGNLAIELDGLDESNFKILDHAINMLYGESTLFEESSKEVIGAIKLFPLLWDVISSIAEGILDSNTLALNRSEIESILRKVGFLKNT